jgi:bifunctional UDP-N-acetylglucosamine pyrophosphorylase/glucosamine-1-phosphate N-acetyltransferase
MNSDLPKVVHCVADEPMVCWVVKASREAGANPIVLVVGHGKEHVTTLFDGDADIRFVTQEPQLGTGHAVDMARDVFADAALADADVFVLAGDGPLIRTQTLEQVLTTHRARQAAATLATAIIDDPTGYGRIVRDAAGHFERIVEQKDATEDELRICEVNPSYYCFRASVLFDLLTRIENNNASGEYYITDVLSLMLANGHRVEVVDAVPSEDVLSINTPAQLEQVSAILQSRLSSMEPKR